jgi:hypothetical protein
MVKRLLAGVSIAVLATFVAGSAAFAQSSGSFSAQISNVEIIPVVVCSAGTLSTSGSTSCSNTGANFLNAQVKTSNGGTSLLLTASLESTILTDTSVNGGSGKQSATAEGSVFVTATVDGVEAPVGCTSNCPNGVAYPPEVTMNERSQTLSANLGDICSTVSGVVVCTTPESIELVLSTTSANSFTFVAPNMSQGTHTVALNIGVSTSANTSSSLNAGALVNVGVGVGSFVAQVVKAQTPFDGITLGSGNTVTMSF